MHDLYHAFALWDGLTRDPDPKRWKANNPEQRRQLKERWLRLGGCAPGALAVAERQYPNFAAWVRGRRH